MYHVVPFNAGCSDGRMIVQVHERGSPETLRDPRGFAVKFYTR